MEPSLEVKKSDEPKRLKTVRILAVIVIVLVVVGGMVFAYMLGSRTATPPPIVTPAELPTDTIVVTDTITGSIPISITIPFTATLSPKDSK